MNLILSLVLRIAAIGASRLCRAERIAAMRERRTRDATAGWAAVELQLAAEDLDPADTFGLGTYVDGALAG